MSDPFLNIVVLYRLHIWSTW